MLTSRVQPPIPVVTAVAAHEFRQKGRKQLIRVTLYQDKGRLMCASLELRERSLTSMAQMDFVDVVGDRCNFRADQFRSGDSPEYLDQSA